MNRTQLINEISAQTGVAAEVTRLVLERAERIARGCLSRREELRLEGFGVLTTRHRPGYIYGKGTSREHLIPPSDVPAIRPSRLLMQEMNRNYPVFAT